MGGSHKRSFENTHRKQKNPKRIRKRIFDIDKNIQKKGHKRILKSKQRIPDLVHADYPIAS